MRTQNPNNCDNCARKKKRCDREQPQCGNCIASGAECSYYDLKKPGPKPGRSKALEDRLRKLEAIVDALNLDEHSASDSNDVKSVSPSQMSKLAIAPVVPASPAFSRHTAVPPHVEAPRPDLEELFLSTGSSYLFLNEEEIRKAINDSLFMRYVVYALGASVAPPSMVSAEFGSRKDMAEVYFKMAETFLRRVFRKPSYHSVLGLFGLVIYCTRTNRGPETFYYYTVGVRIAISIGLNSEEEYKRQGLTDEQKEIMRRTWWTVYLGDRILSALRYESPLIKDEYCLVRLPASPESVFHPQDKMEILETSIMSSNEWYIPTPRNLAHESYLIILVKLHGRIIALSKENKSTRTKLSQAEYLFRECSLSSALRDWYAACPDSIRNVLQDINKDTPPANPKKVWNNAYIMILYYCIKLYLPKKSLLDNIQENVQLAASSSAARETFLAGCDCAAIVQCFLKHNPSFHYVPPFIASCLFGAGIMLLVVSRMNLNPNDVALAEFSYQTVVTSLAQQSALYNIGTSQKALLDRLETCRDPVLLVLAIKSLKNMKGEAYATSSSEMLLADPDEISGATMDALSDGPLDTQFRSMGVPMNMGMTAYANTELLETVAELSNPYAELLMGVGMSNPEPTFDQLFDFSGGAMQQ
ncbi:hypothetical protein HK103_001470 [Boothiomyces macroporosus]|uniref:Zn(2)-C6 fungal-type domain-containing protein n=1 Tax=Boothiomyces macroporosus TaxID=261099 RepID=A0AAD5UJN7_9FUNG|nr:hypothetical protein HK103_001470 [Boothiomyces macroporosus]